MRCQQNELKCVGAVENLQQTINFNILYEKIGDEYNLLLKVISTFNFLCANVVSMELSYLEG